MKFWCIDEPRYESDYRHAYVNGKLGHPFTLPAADCEHCSGVSWRQRPVPYHCPEQMRKNDSILDPAAHISVAQHESLQRELMDLLGIDGNPFDDLRPGDEMLPCYLDVPSRPEADFLWPSTGRLIVSERINDCLKDSADDEIASCPVILRKIGDKSVKAAARPPASGEPEDLVDEISKEANHADMGRYYQIVVHSESKHPPERKLTGTCDVCRREFIEDSLSIDDMFAVIDDMIAESNFSLGVSMNNNMWDGSDIFMLATTEYVIVSDDLKQKIARLQPSNVVFREL